MKTELPNIESQLSRAIILIGPKSVGKSTTAELLTQQLGIARYSLDKICWDYYSVYEDEELFRRIQQVLAPYPHVILLLPSPDPDESFQILDERQRDLPDDLRNMNRHFLGHSSNHQLARFTVYTKDKTVDQTCAEILGLIQGEP